MNASGQKTSPGLKATAGSGVSTFKNMRYADHVMSRSLRFVIMYDGRRRPDIPDLLWIQNTEHLLHFPKICKTLFEIEVKKH